MPDSNLLKLRRKTMIATARAAVGSTMFQHMYVRDKQTREEHDTMQGGELSCAFFVSSILCMFGLLDDSAHSTIATTLAKMKERGWYEIDEPIAGAVVHWPANDVSDHLGIYVGDNRYVSNSYARRTPIEHGSRLSDDRDPDAYYWHVDLNQG